MTDMRVTASKISTPVATTRLSSDAIAEQGRPHEVPDERQARESREPASVRALIPSAAMSFAINPDSNSITVTLADLMSGEVLRQLVYEFGGLPSPASDASGGRVDVTA